ncbi:MAG: type II secretion system protein [Bacilli bacterium]
MITKMIKFKNNEDAFTIMEVVIVMSIMAILIGILIMNVSPVTDKTAALKIKSEFQDIYDVAETYRLSTSKVDKDDLTYKLGNVLTNEYESDPFAAKRYRIEDVVLGTPPIPTCQIELTAEIDDKLRLTTKFIVKKKSEMKITCKGDEERGKALVSSGVCDEWKR